MNPHLPTDRLFPHLPDAWILAEEQGWLALNKPSHVLSRPRLRAGRKGAVTNELLARLAAARGLSPDDPEALSWSRVLEAIDGSKGAGGALASAASGVVLVAKDKTTAEVFAAHLKAGKVRQTWVAGVSPWRGRGPALAGLVAGLKAQGLRLKELERRGDRGLIEIQAVAGAGLRPLELLKRHGLSVAGLVSKDAGRGARGAGERGALARPLWHRSAVSWPHEKVVAPVPDALTRWLRGEPEPLSERLAHALPARYALARGDIGACYRLLDDEKSLTVDRYGSDLVVSVFSELPDPFVDQVAFDGVIADARALACAVGEQLRPRRVYLKVRPRQANTVIDAVSAGLVPPAPVWGEPLLSAAQEPQVVTEWGLRYRVELGATLSSGLFLDQRDNRRWLLDHSEGAAVLNTFSYTCSMSVAAGAGRARRTVSIDASGGALDRGRENLKLNKLVDPEVHDLIRGDVLSWLPRMERRGDRFDTVILDPPSYSNLKGRRFTVLRDYAELARMGVSLVAPGGHLLACINHSRVDAAGLEKRVREGCAMARREILTMEHRRATIDHPNGRMKSVWVKLR